MKNQLKNLKQSTKNVSYRALMVACMVTLSACGGSGEVVTAPKEPSIDQANLCQVNAWGHDEVASKCKAGQKIVFLPESFGNEQLPVIFAAVNCDLRYNIALTNGGVTCIYSPITPSPEPSNGK